ncbi:MAG: FG-GAP repeat protein [Myxococcota bacterium]
MNGRRTAAFGIGLSALVCFGACSGGGGGGDSQAAPDAPAAFALELQAVKNFRFSWTDVAGETEYRLLENPDGSSGFTQVATIAADATSHDLVVPLVSRVNAQYILQACNAADCSDSATVFVSGTLEDAIGYAKPSNAGSGFEQAGTSVALDGNGRTLVIGAPGESNSETGVNGNQNTGTVATQSGAVYVYVRSGRFWSLQAYLKASNTDAGDFFGFSVAISGDGTTLAVGAPNEDSSFTGIDSGQNDDNAEDSGAVYVFVRPDGFTWSQQAYVKAGNTDAGDGFGGSVALSDDGNLLVIGASGEDGAGTGTLADPNSDTAGNSGAAYVLSRSGTTWSQTQYLKASNTGGLDRFGSSVSLSSDGNTLAVGAPGEDSAAIGIGGDEGSNGRTDSGAVYVFLRSLVGVDFVWAQQAYVKAGNPGQDDQFGGSVAISGLGSTLAVGATLEDGSSAGVGGSTNDSLTDAGAVYVFSRSGTSWSQQSYIKASNPGSSEFFGTSLVLSFSGDSLVVGAEQEDGDATGVGGNGAIKNTSLSGAAYAYRRVGGAWSFQRYLKASNTGSGDRFGRSVAIVGEGTTIAVGARLEDGSAAGTGATQDDDAATSTGAVYLY